MSLPYIPGWWDTISQNAQRFAQALPQSIEPEGVANRRFQQLIQQNPTIMQDFANMDPAMRQSMAQAMGMKSVPQALQDLPKGEKLKQQEFVAGLSPAMQERYRLGQAGLKTESEYSMAERAAKLELETGELRNQVATGQVKDMKRADKLIEDAALAYPSLRGVNFTELAKQVVRTNDQVDPTLITAISADPGAKQLFDTAVGVQRMKYESDLRAQLAQMKGPDDKRQTAMELLRVLQLQGNSLENQLQQMNANRKAWQEDPANLFRPFPGDQGIQQIQQKLAENSGEVEKLYQGILSGAGIQPKPTVDPDRIKRLMEALAGSAGSSNAFGLQSGVIR